MIIVFASVIGFFGVFFWQVDRLNSAMARRHVAKNNENYLWQHKVTKHA